MIFTVDFPPPLRHTQTMDNAMQTNPGHRNARARDASSEARLAYGVTPRTTFGVITVVDSFEAYEAAQAIDAGGLALIAEVEG